MAKRSPIRGGDGVVVQVAQLAEALHRHEERTQIQYASNNDAGGTRSQSSAYHPSISRSGLFTDSDKASM